MFFDNRELKNNIKKLEEENGKLQNIVQEQRMQIQHLQTTNQSYEEQYVNTGLECDSCHTSLQPNFHWCPRCGKKIEKQVKSVESNENIFMTEDDGDECIIVGYRGFHDKEITIPTYISGKKVIGIWNKAFYCCKEIERVVFEDGCLFIGHQAFFVCTALKEIILPKTLKEIGNEAFNCTSLTEVIVPANVNSIGVGAFKQCNHLKRVVLPEKLEYIADELLAKSPVEELVLPEDLTAIGSYAFQGTSLRELELPVGLQKISCGAFDSCKELQKLVIYSNVTEIDRIIDSLFERYDCIVYCEAGSEAQQFARTNNLKCEEIAVPSNISRKKRMGVRRIDVSMRDITVEKLRRMTRDKKSATWSWHPLIGRFEMPFTIGIDRYFSMEEALVVKSRIEQIIGVGVDVRLFKV